MFLDPNDMPTPTLTDAPAPESGDPPADPTEPLGEPVPADPPAPEISSDADDEKPVALVKVGARCRKCMTLVIGKVPANQRTGSIRCTFCGYDAVYFSR